MKSLKSEKERERQRVFLPWKVSSRAEIAREFVRDARKDRYKRRKEEKRRRRKNEKKEKESAKGEEEKERKIEREGEDHET